MTVIKNKKNHQKIMSTKEKRNLKDKFDDDKKKKRKKKKFTRISLSS